MHYSIVVVLSLICVELTYGSHVSTKWKNKVGFQFEVTGNKEDDTSSQIKDWQKHDSELHQFLKRIIPEAIEHTGKFKWMLKLR